MLFYRPQRSLSRTRKGAIKREESKVEQEDSKEEVREKPPIVSFSFDLFEVLSTLRGTSEKLSLLCEADDINKVSQIVRKAVGELSIGERGDMKAFVGTIAKILQKIVP